jgi:hypothetical protein
LWIILFAIWSEIYTLIELLLKVLWNKKVLFHMMSRKIAIVEDEEFFFNRFEKKYDSEQKLQIF